MKLAIPARQGNIGFVQPLLHDLDYLCPQQLEIGKVRRIDDGQLLRQLLVMQAITDPRCEVVVELRIVEPRPQQATPEVVVDGFLGGLQQRIAEFSQRLGAQPGGYRNQRAVAD